MARLKTKAVSSSALRRAGERAKAESLVSEVGKPAFYGGPTLSPDQVREIIRACRGAGVSSLSYAGLSLIFEKRLDDNLDTASQPARPTNQTATPTAQDLDAARKRLADLHAASENADVEERLEAQSYEMSNLMITDPVAYEARLDEMEQTGLQSGE